MRVSVDSARCQGHGQCAMTAPAVFGSDTQGMAVLLVEEVPDEQEAAVEMAVLRCPERAITAI